MVFGKFISSFFQGNNAGVVGQGIDEDRKIRKDTKMVDVAHEALSKRGYDDRAALEGLVKMGWPHVKREKFWHKVRKRVWQRVSSDYDSSDNEMVDEITDRIVEVAEADEYYKEIFDRDDA